MSSAFVRAVLAQLVRAKDADPQGLATFNDVLVGEVLQGALSDGVLDTRVVHQRLMELGTHELVITRTIAVVTELAPAHGVTLRLPGGAHIVARPEKVRPLPGPPATSRAALAPNLPESLPEAMFDLVLRHDGIDDELAAPGRAFLAQQIDRARGRALDLTNTYEWVAERAKGATCDEIVLSLAAVAHALRIRVALPNATVALPPAQRARLLQGFVRRCPPSRATAALPKPTAPPPASPDLDYLSSVVTNTLVRDRRKRRGIAAGIGAAVVAAVAVSLTLIPASIEEETPEAALPPPPTEPKKIEPGSDEARARAAFVFRSAKRALTEGAVQQAHTDATRALVLDPELHDALQLLSVVEAQLGNAQAACARMKEYVAATGKRGVARRKLVKSACPRR